MIQQPDVTVKSQTTEVVVCTFTIHTHGLYLYTYGICCSKALHGFRSSIPLGTQTTGATCNGGTASASQADWRDVRLCRSLIWGPECRDGINPAQRVYFLQQQCILLTAVQLLWLPATTVSDSSPCNGWQRCK